jgi:hypothetical protein
VATGLACAASLAANSAQASPSFVWAKQGATGAAVAADVNSCTDAAHGLNGTSSVPVPITGMLASGVISALLAENATKEVRKRSIARCMHQAGYQVVPITAEEQAAFQASRAADRQKWFDHLLGQSDFAQRIAAAAAAPTLPEAAPEPFTYGAIRLDPDALTAEAGVVRPGGAVLQGKIAYRRVARLVADVDLFPETGGRVRVRAGTPLSQAVFSEEDGTPRSYWCGIARVNNSDLLPITLCARNDDAGYFAILSRGPAWLTTGLNLSDNSSGKPGIYRLEDLPTPDPLDLAVIVVRVSDRSILLDARVKKGHDTQSVWRKELPLGPSGEAVLPFWTHRLVLSRSNDGVTARFPADGDNRGWP